MTFKLGQVLIAKKSFQNHNTHDSFFVKNQKYTIRVVHIDFNRKFDDSKDPFRSIDYILVNNLPGYTFNIEEIYKDRNEYIWNCFYTPNELRKNKLKKLNKSISLNYI